MSSAIDKLFREEMESEVLFETVLDEDPMTEAFLDKCIKEADEANKNPLFDEPLEG